MKFNFVYILILFSLLSCRHSERNANSVDKKNQIKNLLKVGHDIYRTKNDAITFATSMMYFDSAIRIAQEINDPLLLGNAYFSKGSVYDAWNRDKDKTIYYFTKSYETFKPLKLDSFYTLKKIYIHHLIAHGYEKKGDSSNTIKYILGTLDLIKKVPDSHQYSYDFIPQLALIASFVQNYTLAEDILENSCRKITIKNNPETYNYLDYSYLTRARIDIYGHKKSSSPYLDSFYKAYTVAKTPIDSIEMLEKLYPMYLFINNQEMGYKTMRDYIALDRKLNSAEILLEAQDKLNHTEESLKNAETENLRKTNWLYIISLISLVLILGSVALYLNKIKKEKDKLSQLLMHNEELRLDLEKQNQTNLLLNKEIHHRIKNNLQFIHSLIDMQISHTKSNEVKKELEDTQFRIRSVSNSYDMMRKEVQINLKDGLNQFLNEFLQNFKNHKSIQWICNIESIELEAKYTIPIFVILNELITNTIKHSNNLSPITAIIDIFYSEETLTLNYKDQNVLSNHSESNKMGLGMEIIELLVLQLKGNLIRTDHYEYKITFPYKLKKSSPND